ncbi:MAG: DUF2807 domain-containing protein [Muribaculaceae bacterium]|nr:DUF2807 domain-containing protein [Muribaculaceae bacterium]
MRNKIISTIAISAIGILSTSCIKIGTSQKDYGEAVTTTVNITEDFNTIITSGITDIEFVPGPVSMTLTAPEKIIDNIKIEVRNGTLYVEEKKGFEIKNFSNNFQAKLTVSAPSVSKFETTGIGDFEIKRLHEKEVSLITTGTGDISLQTARCTKLSAHGSGTGDIDISYLSCVVAECSTSGTGDITFTRLVADRLNGTTSGIGDITVSGECKEATLESSGMGDINRKGLEIIHSGNED